MGTRASDALGGEIVMNEFDNNNNNNEQDRAYGSSAEGNSPSGGVHNAYNNGSQPSQTGYPNYGYSNYTYPRQPQSGYNYAAGGEYAYRPQKKNKKKHKALNAVLAVVFVLVLAGSSIVGYSLLTDKRPLLGLKRTDSSSQTPNGASDRADDDSSFPERDMSDLPTIEELAAPADAMSIPDIVKKMSPSVVGISAIIGSTPYSGTGIIMSDDGYIITNAHVVDGASAISVVITDKTSKTEQEQEDSSSKTVAEKILENQNNTQNDDDDDNSITAQLIGIDVQTDIAVLKIDKTGLTPAEFGTSDDLLVGELAIVIGNPLGFDLSNSVTSGIISATDRTLTIEDRTMNLIQTDASINSGNSGGPLINAYGQVIGITSAKVSSTYGEGLGFAIPISEAKEIINDLIQYGYVKGRPTLGISGTNISSFYAQYYQVPQGFIIVSIESGSAAEKAGMQVNDIVVGIEGELITSIEDFNEIKSRYKAGDTISVSVYRGDNIIDLDVTLDEALDQSESQQGSQPQDNGGMDGFEDFYNFYNNFR